MLRSLQAKLSVVNGTAGLLSGFYTPFFGAWLAWRGLSAPEIGVLVATGLLLRVLVSPMAGIVADALNDRRSIMLALALASAIFYGAMPFASLAFLILLAVPGNVFSGSIFPLLDSVVLRNAERDGFDYGRVRMWASIFFMAGTVLSGYLVWLWGIVILPYAFAIIMAASAAAIFALKSRGIRNPAITLGTRFRMTLAETRELLRSKIFLLFAITAGLSQGSHAVYYSYGGLHWRELGYSDWVIGAVWPIGVLVEIVFMSMSLKLFRMFGATKLLMLGAASCLLRWFIMGFDPPFALLLFAQLLHGTTFAVGHLGAMYFLLSAVPPRLAATAQSLYSVFWGGLAMGAGTLAAGYVYDWAGGGVYFLMAAMGFVALLTGYWLSRIWKGQRLTSGSAEDTPSV